MSIRIPLHPVIAPSTVYLDTFAGVLSFLSNIDAYDVMLELAAHPIPLQSCVAWSVNADSMLEVRYA